LRLIDLTREAFDLVAMNPPFGALGTGVKDLLARAYPGSKNDLLAIFVERGLQLLRPGGRMGAPHAAVSSSPASRNGARWWCSVSPRGKSWPTWGTE